MTTTLDQTTGHVFGVPGQRIRSALYLDFDNIMSGLMGTDPNLAMHFAQDPSAWLAHLGTAGLPDGQWRDFRVLRCYLNPTGYVIDTRLGGSSRITFARFRQTMLGAGFEVIDCPKLTKQGKNAADIKMVLDVIDGLTRSGSVDEVAMASGDADFTPLLQRIRAEDRRTLVISSNETAHTYRSVADTFIGRMALCELISRSVVDAEQAGIHVLAPPATTSAQVRDLTELRVRAAELLVARVSNSPVPLNLANVGQQLRATFGAEVISSTGWFGCGSMSAALQGPLTSSFCFSSDYVWDPARHMAPCGAFQPAEAS
jgi:hypothetical protein